VVNAAIDKAYGSRSFVTRVCPDCAREIDLYIASAPNRGGLVQLQGAGPGDHLRAPLGRQRPEIRSRRSVSPTFPQNLLRTATRDDTPEASDD
jgi:hypothetical protein